MTRHLPWRQVPSRPATTPVFCRFPTFRLRQATSSLLALLVLGVLASPALPQQTDDDRVEAYLAEMGLPELQIVYLEGEIKRGATEGRRLAAARRLADLYAARLAYLTDPKKVAELTQTVQELVKAYPAANTPALQVMLLQGDYNRAEALLGAWLNDPASATGPRDEARKVLAQLTPQLAGLEEKLHPQLQKEQDALAKMPEGPARKALQERVNTLAGAAGRSSYLAGWCNYYLGLTSKLGGQANGLTEFQQARRSFNRLFEGTDVLNGTTSAGELGLGSEARARSALGMALAEMGSNNDKAGEAWFALLRTPGVFEDVRDQAPTWHIFALLAAGKEGQAQALAEKEINAFSDAFTPGKARLCMLLVREGYGGPQRKPELAALGLQGLVHMKQVDLASALLAKYKVSLASAKSFQMQWLRGQSMLSQAKKETDYLAAAAVLEAALGLPDARQEAVLAARCRMSLGLCYYKAGAPDQALPHLQQAATALRLNKSPVAADAAWAQVVCLMALVAKNASQQPAAVDALRAFANDFPDHPEAKKVPLLLAQLRNEALPLDKLDPKDPTYAEAVLAACRRRSGLWKRTANDPAAREAAATALREAVNKFLALPETPARTEGRLECLLMLVDLAMNGSPADLAQARQHMAKAEALAGSLAPESRVAGEYHYNKLMLARAAGDAAQAAAEARWLTEHQPGSPYETLALIIRAKEVETTLATADDAGRKAAQDDAIKVFRRLSQVLGDDLDTLKANKNAVVALSRLGSLNLDAGQASEAAACYDKLLEVYPRDSNYLRRAGLAHFQAKQYEKSLACWKPLLRGLPRNSEPWYEAKYYHMAALARLDVAEARKEFQQFKVLFPDLGPGDWPNRMKALEKELQ